MFDELKLHLDEVSDEVPTAAMECCRQLADHPQQAWQHLLTT